MTDKNGNATSTAVHEPAGASAQFAGDEGLDEDSLLIVTYMLSGQTYGGDILQIQEVTVMNTITRVPHVMAYIRGVTNLRGNIVPTIDLRLRLGMEERENGQGGQIMIAHTAHGLIGYIVDSVREVINVPKSAIEPTPDDWLDVDHKYFAGIAKMDDLLVTIVDFNKVIQADRVLLDEFRQG